MTRRYFIPKDDDPLQGKPALVTQKRRPKRWTLEELRALEQEWSGGVNYPASRFLDSLEAS